MERGDYRNHPCYDPKTGILKGFICPFCLKIYPIEDQAIQCRESHDDFEIDYVFEKGKRFPLEILVKRVKGDKIIEVGTYGMKKLEVLDDEGKVKETKTEE